MAGRSLPCSAQLGLLQERALASGRRAVLFVALAWGVPLLRLSTIPISKSALLPLVAAGATQMPLKDLMKIAKGLLL